MGPMYWGVLAGWWNTMPTPLVGAGPFAEKGIMAANTILVADDDPVILRLLEVNFEMEGFNVVTAEDGAVALERARQSKPDVIVLDVMMPKMTGHEVAEALRGDPDLASIPVIFVSAKAQGADVARGMELGAADYVTKPFDPMDLVERVAAVLEKSRAR